MKKMISRGLYVLCYDSKMKLKSEIGPFKTEAETFARLDKEKKSGKWRHVEAAERVHIK